MHKTKLRPDVVERIIARRGQLHVHEQIDASRTALVVIDMQNAFVASDNPSTVSTAEQIVPAINQLASAVRDSGGTVAWVISSFDESTLTNWSAFFGGIYSAQFSAAVIANLTIGADGHALFPSLDYRRNDAVVEKDRFSAFFPGHCELPALLRARGIDTVIICGTLTNVCCESSARDAMMDNFSVIMASDANAALSDQDHNASLNALAQTFADVMSCDEIAARLAG